jgi:flagellar assembly protein FliH
MLPAENTGPPAETGTTIEPVTPEDQAELTLIRATMRATEIEKDAFEKGFAEGRAAALQAAQAVVDSMLGKYAASLDQLNKLRREIFASSEQEVIRLALAIARKVIKREIAIDDELILTLVKVALNRIAVQTLITIRVNPKDYDFIQRHQAALPGAGPLNETMKLVEDPLIDRGGCLIETESGTIDARIEEQLREIEKGLFE